MSTLGRSTRSTSLFAIATALIGTLATAGATAASEETRPADVSVQPQREDRFALPARALDRLASRATVTIAGSGFSSGTTATVQQCSANGTCAASLPVTFDESGSARFLVEVTERFATSAGENVDCSGPIARCVITVGTAKETAEVPIVFEVPASPPPRVFISKVRARSGDVVRVTARGFPARSSARVTQCVPRSCETGATRTAIAFDDRGDATVDYRVRTTGGCRLGRPCAVAVVVPGLITGANVAPLAFTGSSTAAYTPSRLMFGVGLAVVLLALAAWLLATSDWSPVGEHGPASGTEPAPVQ